jgi:hypothetical protein
LGFDQENAASLLLLLIAAGSVCLPFLGTRQLVWGAENKVAFWKRWQYFWPWRRLGALGLLRSFLSLAMLAAAGATPTIALTFVI